MTTNDVWERRGCLVDDDDDDGEDDEYWDH